MVAFRELGEAERVAVVIGYSLPETPKRLSFEVFYRAGDA